MLMQGFANTNPAVIRAALPTDPPRENWDHGLWGRGFAVAMMGTVAGREGTVPSFSCQMSPTCSSGLGFDSDFFGNMKLPNGDPDFASMLKWFQQGGIGRFTRYEMAGYDAYALLYWALADSQLLAQKGDDLLSKLYAFFGPAVVNSPTPRPTYVGQQFPEE